MTKLRPALGIALFPFGLLAAPGPAIEYRLAAGDRQRRPPLARELVVIG